MDYSDDDVLENESGEETSKRAKTSPYVVLKEEEIRKHQRDDIEQVSTVLSISHVEAIILLLHYQWSVSKVGDEWFTDEERVRKTVGILKEPVVDLNGKEVNIHECGICFKTYLQKEIATASCGHPYCNTCWTRYIGPKINKGPGCLLVSCPEPSCCAVVGHDIIDKVITKGEDKNKYDRYFLRSYVEASGKKMKWCPSPGCGCAIDLASGSENDDVSCLCSYKFCGNCSEEAHRPVDCETVSKWILKQSDGSHNPSWMHANRKPCPNCYRHVEKNQGCNHMSCSICKFQFCWICYCSLKGHKNCHQFKASDETGTKRKREKNAIDRYVHYYGRWESNHSSRLKAIADLERWRSVQLRKLSFKLGTPETQLQFTLEAWLQIVECRRVLKWTYAYGYYLPKYERTKRRFFEYMQGEAEVGLEMLHLCAEQELKPLVDEAEDPSQSFYDFRTKLTALTKATKANFENLVEALEYQSKPKTNSKPATKT